MSLRKLLLIALLPALLLGSGCSNRREAVDRFNTRHSSVLKDLLAVAPQCMELDEFNTSICDAAAEILTYENPKTSTNRFISLVDEQNEVPVYVITPGHYRGKQMERVRAIAVPALLKKYDQVGSDYTREMRPKVATLDLNSQSVWFIFKQEHTALLTKSGTN